MVVDAVEVSPLGMGASYSVAERDVLAGAADDGAAPDRDRDDVGHPEVRTDAADLDGRRRLAREAGDERPDVGRRAADVHDERVAPA